MLYENLANDLRIYRRDNKLTQAQLGRLLGVSRQTVSNWELCKDFPQRKNLDKFYELLSPQREPPF